MRRGGNTPEVLHPRVLGLVAAVLAGIAWLAIATWLLVGPLSSLAQAQGEAREGDKVSARDEDGENGRLERRGGETRAQTRVTSSDRDGVLFVGEDDDDDGVHGISRVLDSNGDFDIDDIDDEIERAGGSINCDQILDIANEGHHDNNIQNLAYGDVIFGDQIIAPHLIQNCISEVHRDRDNGEIIDVVEDRTGEPDGVVLDTSNLAALPNTGILSRSSAGFTAGLPGGASIVAFAVLGTSLVGMSAWRFFGSRRGRSGD